MIAVTRGEDGCARHVAIMALEGFCDNPPLEIFQHVVQIGG